MKKRAKFQFQQSKIEMEIAGGVYTVTPSPDIPKKAAKFQAKAEKMIPQIEKKLISDTEYIKLCKDIIDDFCGKGSFNSIFKDRIPNIRDCTNLTVFIINEITAYYKD